MLPSPQPSQAPLFTVNCKTLALARLLLAAKETAAAHGSFTLLSLAFKTRSDRHTSVKMSSKYQLVVMFVILFVLSFQGKRCASA